MGKSFEELTDEELRKILLHISDLLEERQAASKKDASPEPKPTQTAPTTATTSTSKDDKTTNEQPAPKKQRTSKRPAHQLSPIDIPTRNRFEELSNPGPSNAEQPPTKNATPKSKQAAITAETDKRPSIPPIVLRDKQQWTKVSADLQRRKIHYTKAANTKDGISIHTATEDDYRTLYKCLETLNAPFHTFQLRSEKSLRVVLRGIIQDISVEEIEQDLKYRSYETIKITRLQGKDKRPAPLVLVELDKKYKSIYNLDRCYGLSITVESKKMQQGARQCHKCQLYGHTQPNCHANYKCMKCAGDHSTHECTKPKTVPAKCSNCGGEHPSTYSGCPSNPNKVKKTFS